MVCHYPRAQQRAPNICLHLIALTVGVHVERRDMARESLLQMLEDLASKVRSFELEKRQAAAKIEALERERNEAVATARALEREVGEMAALISQAGDKVDEILKIGANDDVSQPQPVNTPATSTAPKRLGEFSADPQKQPKRLLP